MDDARNGKLPDSIASTVADAQHQARSYEDMIAQAAKPPVDPDALVSETEQWLDQKPDELLKQYVPPVPAMPSLPDMPAVPGMPPLPALPAVPEMPAFPSF